MEKLCFVVAEHKVFGFLCLPYIVETERQPTYKLLEPAIPEMATNGRITMTDTELTVVKQLNQLTDTELCKRFTPKETVKTFINTIKTEIVRNFIRPFIDNTIAKVLPIMAEHNMLMFNRRQGYNGLYETDIITFEKGLTRSKFFFTLDDTQTLRYSLSINIKNGSEITEKQLIAQNIIELVYNPAALIIKNVLYQFNNIESKKFIPFSTKKYIMVKPETVPMYMNNFVKKCIADHYVIAKGFSIKKRENLCQAILNIEQNVIGSFIALSFSYGNELYTFGSTQRIIDLVKENNTYTFYNCRRHITEENNYADILIDLGLKHSSNNLFELNNNNSHLIEPLIEWINTNKSQLDESQFQIKPINNNNQNYYYGKYELQIEIRDVIDWFDIYAKVIFDGFEIPFARFKHHILHGERKYILPNGNIFILPEEWFTKWTDVMSFGNINGEKIQLKIDHKKLLPNDYIEQENINHNETISISQTPLQGALNATLRPYQYEGFQWLNTLYENKKGGILADDMGLGKTIQTIALLSHIYATATKRDNAQGTLFDTYNDTILEPSLIVMPVSLIHNWNNEINKFAPHLKVYTYIGYDRPKSTQISKIFQHYHIVLTTYGLLRNDINYLSTTHFTYLILDESQNIKNSLSLTYRAVSEIKANYYLTISGTPIENSLNDLWAQMNIVNKGLLGNATFFHNFFVQPIEKKHSQTSADKLKLLINPYILRRTKNEVAKELPPLTEQTIYCDMTEEQAEIYEEEKSSVRNELLNITDTDIQNKTFMALKALTRLRLIANHPQFARPTYEGTSGKTEQVMEQIKNIIAEGHKMLIFSSFTKDLEMFRNKFEQNKIKYCMLTGKNIGKEREQIIKVFQDNDSIHTFLISLKAGGVGLNLTQADYVLMLNPWWNPQAEKQAIDRAHRIGQTKHVMVYRFITKDSIEEKIEQLQAQKRTLAGTFINNNNPLLGLTPEEIKELIK